MAWHKNKNLTIKTGSYMLRLSACTLLAVSLNACSSMSLSDFGLGSDNKQTVATKQTPAPDGPVSLGGQPKTSATTAKKQEKGVWDKMTGWFRSSDEPKVATAKQDNLAASQLSQTNAATNASLRAAQDLSRLQQSPNTVSKITQTPGQTVSVQTLSPSAPKVLTPQVTAPKVSAPQVATNIQSPSNPSVQTPTINQPNSIVATKPADENFLDRIGNWFSSDKKKSVTTTKQTPKSSINGLATSTVSSPQSTVSSDAQSLTPVQTLRLARNSSSNTSASAQGLVPYVPNSNVPNSKTAHQTNTQLQTGGTSTVKSTVPQKITIKSAPKISKPRVAVRKLASPSQARQSARIASKTSTPEKTEYVVTPESYRASRNTTSQIASAPTRLATAVPTKPVTSLRSSAKSDYLGTAPLNQNATKFYFGPGSTSLAPHHIAQLKGIAGQAIARQRQIVVLGTSTPGGEAGSGTSTQGLQRLATARAMTAAQNLQKFGVPSNLIKIKIAQSTTPTDIGTGGNSSFQALSARRVEITLQ